MHKKFKSYIYIGVITIIYCLSADLYIVTGRIVQLMFFLFTIYVHPCIVYRICSFMCATAVALLTLRRKQTRCTWHENRTNPRVCTVYPYAASSGFASAFVPREKAAETVRNRGFERFIHTVHRRETAVLLVPREKA